MSEEKPTVKSWRDAIRLFLCGICMGTADLVPGVSGGTMAFITGIYEDLLRSIKTVNAGAIRDLLTLRWQSFASRVAWRYLFVILLGMGFAVGTLAQGIIFLLNHEEQRSYLFAAFFGLILGSVFFCFRKVEHWGGKELSALLFGLVFAFLITSIPIGQHQADVGFDVSIEEVAGLQLSEQAIQNYDAQKQMLTGVPGDVLAAMLAKGYVSAQTRAYSHVEQRVGVVQDFVKADHGLRFDPWLMVCGMIGISAMLLPGISGSYLLTILGTYPLVIGALADLAKGVRALHIDMEAVAILGSLGVGVLCGLAVFTRIITWLLREHHDAAMTLLIGFMLGAIRAVWPFWSYSYYLIPLKLQKGLQLLPMEPQWPGLESTALATAGLVALGSCLLVIIMEVVASRLNRAQ